jgi:hypothetical protein
MKEGRELADWETISAVQKLMERETEFDYALYAEFGIGNNPYGRGASGLHGGVTKGQCLSYALAIQTSIENKMKQLLSLRNGGLVGRTHAICAAMMEFKP